MNRFKVYLIKLLVGNEMVIINAHLENATIGTKEGNDKGLIADCVLMHCEFAFWNKEINK